MTCFCFRSVVRSAASSSFVDLVIADIVAAGSDSPRDRGAMGDARVGAAPGDVRGRWGGGRGRPATAAVRDPR
jgi:hypothetical protein